MVTAQGKENRWEYCRLFVLPEAQPDAEDKADEADLPVVSLLEAIEKLDEPDQVGWHVLRIGIVRDGQGRPGLDTHLKRLAAA